jgi:DNA invertase Pin-like site-specific DNA recombinase
MDAVIYTRSARPSPELVEMQRAVCRRMAAGHGFEVAGEFHDDGPPGLGLAQLLATVRGGEVSAVVVADFNRFGRALDAFARVMGTLDEAEVPLYVVGHGRMAADMRAVLDIPREFVEYR